MLQGRKFPPVRGRPQSEPELPPSRLESWRQKSKRLYTRFHSIVLVATAVVITLAAVLAYNSTRQPPQRLTQRDIDAAVTRTLASATPKPSYASLAYETIHPSLVRVNALVSKSGGKTQGALGTGVVIDDSGTILTNLHVVKDAIGVQVVFADGTESDAAIIVRQPENDLAVIRASIIPDDLVPATLAGAGGLRVGDEVFAAGNPFGINNSLSAGVVSGLGRAYKSPKTGITLSNLIQFDAAVNPGNSGGPLVNRDGEVVGIVTALLNPTEQEFFVGIGFAVTIETAAAAMGTPPY